MYLNLMKLFASMTFSEDLLKRLNEIWNGKIQCIIDVWMTLLKDSTVGASWRFVFCSRGNLYDQPS